jgi:hypothetical protein
MHSNQTKLVGLRVLMGWPESDLEASAAERDRIATYRNPE